MLKFLHRWFIGSSRVRDIATQVRKLQFRPQLDILDDRFAPAVFNVNTVAEIFNPLASFVTLGSAFEAPSATPNNNTIDLTVPDPDSIALPGTPGGALNTTNAFTISAASGNQTTQNSSSGTVTVNNNSPSRVFGINPIVPIGSAIVTDGGQSLTSASTVTLAGGTGATATAIAIAQVTGVSITDPSSGSTSAPTVPFTGGGGQGAAATAIHASPKIAVTLSSLTIENGNASGGDVPGGAGDGIRDNDNASLTLTKIAVTNDSASADRGGVSMAGLFDTPWALTLNPTTVSDNHAGAQGGGTEEDGTPDKRTKFKPITIYS